MPESLSAIQAEFTNFLRQQTALPAGHPQQQAFSLYQSLVHDNLSAAIEPCFPVLRQILPAERWHQLISLFIKQQSCRTPLFHQLPEQFVLFLQDQALPDYPFAADLAHYEWLELAVDTAPDFNPALTTENIMDRLWPAHPAIQVAAYQYPVDQIAPQALPSAPEACYMLVYRNQQQTVNFVRINELTYVLLNSLFTHSLTPRQTVKALCDQYPSLPSDKLLEELAQILRLQPT